MGEHIRIEADTVGAALAEAILDLLDLDQDAPPPKDLSLFTSAIDIFLGGSGAEVRVYNDSDEGKLYANLGQERIEARLPVGDPRSFVLTKDTLVHGQRTKWLSDEVLHAVEAA
jgi:hypothetical protein